MKKFLEVSVDDDGKFHFSTEEAFTTEHEFAAEDDRGQAVLMDAYDRQLRRLVHDLTEFMWKNKDQQVSQAVRSLAIAEIIGCAEPYQRAEEFWDLLTFHSIPQFEHYAAAIKRRYGFDDRSVNRPFIGGTLPDGTLVGGPAGGPMRDIPLTGEPDIMPFPMPQPCGKIVS